MSESAEGISYRHIEQRDCAIAHAHAAVSDAIRNLDLATVHVQAIGDDVHVEHLAGIIRQLAVAREPLAEHIDFVNLTEGLNQ